MSEEKPETGSKVSPEQISKYEEHCKALGYVVDRLKCLIADKALDINKSKERLNMEVTEIIQEIWKLLK